jgi:hypothetical protein
MTRRKLLSILQEETDGFKERSRLRDDVLDAMEQAYIKGKKKQLTLNDVVVPKGTLCDVCGSENTIGAPHMGSNCLDCNPL